MKKFWLTLVVLAVSGLAIYINANPKTIAGLCIPQAYLVTHNVVTDDKNFDQESDHSLATLMFSTEQIQQVISGYQIAISNSLGSELRQPLHVNLSSKGNKASELNLDDSRQLPMQANLYTSTPISEFSWKVYEKNAEGYEYWGNCMDDFDGGLGCFRQLQIDSLYLTYSVEAPNISLYPKIDLFLKQSIQAWQCN